MWGKDSEREREREKIDGGRKRERERNRGLRPGPRHPDVKALRRFRAIPQELSDGFPW